MKKHDVKEKEKRSFKEVVMDNKGKIIAGVSCIAIGTVTFFMYRHHIQIKNNAETIEFVRDVVKEGALEEAIATVNRKINYRLDKIEHLKNHNENVSLDVIKKYEEELRELMAKSESFTKEYNSITIR